MEQIAVIGGGMAGMATAARLQALGFATTVFEAHSHVGGCAGYFRRQGFAFDVGATTLVDFGAGGVGAQLLTAIGMESFDGERLPGYVAHLPDRTVTLHRDSTQWAAERLAALGDTPAHRVFWALLDRLADVFWRASRDGVMLPMRTAADLLRNLRAYPVGDWELARYLTWTMGGVLRHFGLRDDKPLASLLAMLIEDTVHATLDEAPLINAALGVTIRGAGLTRHQGGMWGFWKRFAAHYQAIGGTIMPACRVERVTGRRGAFTLETTRGTFTADQVVSALPIDLTARIAPSIIADRLTAYVRRDAPRMGGAIVVFLGVPESEVADHGFTHHQLLHDYDAPLGMGNNMFISVSAPDDRESAPHGWRAVMISTHCALDDWDDLTPDAYDSRRRAAGERLIACARRVYPSLGKNARVCEVGTPRTYARFTGRTRGAVGGVRQTRWNTNQFAVPHDIGVSGFWLVGDTTAPGLGTVACVLGSRDVAGRILKQKR
ncbi:MAG: NAD(P)/FAD-dependent oxidoreductase [Chloroflexota bacterium]|nr:NAD(P)/FAD-dependent oxidoreductase [Chloroflexota bacterium]